MGRRVSLPKRGAGGGPYVPFGQEGDEPIPQVVAMMALIEGWERDLARDKEARRLALKAMPNRTDDEEAEYAPLKAEWRARKAQERSDALEQARLDSLPPIERARAIRERDAAKKAESAAALAHMMERMDSAAVPRPFQ